MQITVQGYLTLKELVGKHQMSLPAASTLRDLLAGLGHNLGESLILEASAGGRGAAGRLVVLLNGRHSSHLPEGLDTVLQNGDEVAIFPPIAGG